MKLQKINLKKKYPCRTKLCAFRCLISSSQIQFKYLSEKLVLSKINYVLYYQQASIARYQVGLYASNYFEHLTIVSSAFN